MAKGQVSKLWTILKGEDNCELTGVRSPYYAEGTCFTNGAAGRSHAERCTLQANIDMHITALEYDVEDNAYLSISGIDYRGPSHKPVNVPVVTGTLIEWQTDGLNVHDVGFVVCGRPMDPPRPPNAPPVIAEEPPPPGPPGTGTCVNTCRFESDGHCDDGGGGSEYTHCSACTDCADCGPRAHCDFDAPPPPPPPDGKCRVWERLRDSYPYCDPPNTAGDKWSVDLEVALGPDCKNAPSGTGCCYVPLGYKDGPKFGSNCGSVCGASPRVREGAQDAYCQRSDGSSFGNCFCGPELD